MHRIRKTTFMGFRKCPEQGMYMVRDRDNESYGDVNWDIPALANGQLFHHAAEDFWNEMPSDINCNDCDVYGMFNELMPKTKHKLLSVWFKWYADYEASRYIELKKDGLLEYFRPFKMEEAVEAEIDGLIRTGHVDRIDKVGEDELLVVEYKTGYSYDPEKAYAMTNVRSELQWYRSILSVMDSYKDFKIVGWRMINPTVGKVVGGKFSPLTKHSVDKVAENIKGYLNGDIEVKKKIDMHCSMCEWMEECLKYEDEGHEIFGLLKDNGGVK